MPNRSLLPLGMLVPFFATLLSSCVTTRLLKEWKPPEQGSRPVERALVVELSGPEDIRRRLEDEMVAALKRNGVEAVPSYDYFTADEAFDGRKLTEAIARAKVDAVVSDHLLYRIAERGVRGGTWLPAYITRTVLYDVSAKRVAWHAAAKSYSLSDPWPSEYAKQMIDSMKRNTAPCATPGCEPAPSNEVGLDAQPWILSLKPSVAAFSAPE